MIPKFLSNEKRNTLILFDMDGVCAEILPDEVPKILNNEQGVYRNKRPIKTTIKIMQKLCKKQNFTIGILSSCEFENQKQEKLDWLSTYAPFVSKNHIYLINWNKEKISAEHRPSGKLNKIKRIKGFETIYLIEDTQEIIKTTNKVLPNCAHHITEFLK
ncbi:MAG: hypothetical protein MJ152_00465 [Clostridia bacterium]|nr:hypothetical protein [Clostridia bacterium]